MIDYRAWDQEQKIMLYHVQQAYDWQSGGITDSQDNIVDYEEDSFGTFLDDRRYVVQQATGVYDIDCKMIYEGDFVVLNTRIIYTVRFGKVTTASGYAQGFYLTSNTDGTPHQFADQMKIVGNLCEGRVH